MTPRSLHRLATLCAAALLAAAPPVASAVDAAVIGKPPTSPDQPKPRLGNYKIINRGAELTLASCVEGGTVVMSPREKATAARLDRDLQDACKSVDYTK